MEEIITRKFQTLKAEWNERQRRLWAASEAMCLGRGGVSTVCNGTFPPHHQQRNQGTKNQCERFCVIFSEMRPNHEYTSSDYEYQ